MRSAFVFLLLVLSPLAHAADAATTNWPAFRGPDARGVSASEKFPTKWSSTEGVAWKTDVAGRGWSSPIVWGKNVFLTTVVSTGAVEAPKKGLYFGGERPEPSKDEHLWKVICLDVDTGAQRWETVVHKGVPTAPVHVKNSYASETPVTDGKRVYACFGQVGIYAVDFDGKLLWEAPIAPHPMRYSWGTAAGPALHGERLCYVSDNDEASSIVALDTATGKEAWRVAREEKSNWATPFVWTTPQRTEIVTPGSGAVRSYDESGKELWRLTGMSSITIATPYAADGLLYVTSGYVGDKLKPVYAIKPGAMGDISLASGATSNEFIAWSNGKIGPYNPSTVVYDGKLYVLYDRGWLSCFDAKTGTPFYEHQKLEGSNGFTVSPWAVAGHIYCLDENGQCFVVKAGETFAIEGMNSLAEDDMAMSTPALVGDKLILRTAARVYCIR